MSIKNFIRRLFVFLAPLLIGIIFLIWIPIDRSFVYHYLQEDCAGHGSWVYNRLFRNPKPVDIAFIGSSRTIHGPMDQLLEDSLLKKTNDSIAVLTLGYCRLGRNLSLVLLKDLLKHKNPKTLVLEVREDENRYSHPVFPYLAEREDVFQPVMLFNPDLIKDLYLGVRTRFEYHQRKWLNNHPEAYPADYRSYGYGSSQRLADSTFLRQKKAERIIRAERKLKEGGRDFHMRFPRAYLKKIAQLVATHGIQLYFLYLPEYGWPLREPMELATYRQYGEVWIPPADILDNPKHWMDDGHLNDEGARALSGWLVSLLQGN